MEFQEQCFWFFVLFLMIVAGCFTIFLKKSVAFKQNTLKRMTAVERLTMNFIIKLYLLQK